MPFVSSPAAYLGDIWNECDIEYKINSKQVTVSVGLFEPCNSPMSIPTSP